MYISYTCIYIYIYIERDMYRYTHILYVYYVYYVTSYYMQIISNYIIS